MEIYVIEEHLGVLSFVKGVAVSEARAFETGLWAFRGLLRSGNATPHWEVTGKLDRRPCLWASREIQENGEPGWITIRRFELTD